MKIKLLNLIFAVLLVTLLSACGLVGGNSTTQTTVAGGAGGAAIGAGIGALVGTVMSNGDVWASAQLGTAIGAPAGALIAYSYRINKENGEIEKRNKTILDNYDEIQITQDQLNQMEAEIMSDVSELEPTTIQSSYYIGPTIGY